MSAPSGEARWALARKYRTLEALREGHARGEAKPGKATLAALAAEFPGALRELDRLPIEAIRARALALEAAAAGEPATPWMAWVDAWHRLLRAALFVRAGVEPRRMPSGARLAELARGASAHAGVAVDVAFVSVALAPPGGRVVASVRARIAALHGDDAVAWLVAELAADRRG